MFSGPEDSVNRSATRVLDDCAIGLSGLCLVHCVALPAAAALSPLFGSMADTEWVHVAFVLLAAPISAAIFLPCCREPSRRWPLIALATAALGCLALGAFLPMSSASETMFTVSGSVALAGAHLMNRRHTAGRRPPL
jgi:hypothetical protein